MSIDIRYPDVHVALGDLSGPDGNAFSILTKVLFALNAAGLAYDVRQDFEMEATASDYDQLLATVYRWVTVTDSFYVDEWDDEETLDYAAIEAEAYGEALMAQYDDDPSPYGGTYSEM
jgi:hypothetical protein|tara:strand:+ start:557 stop:910 length:354 start_codon:yes stop_codon:yes gene_type:complete